MIDARGLSCPIPVVMVQKEVKKNNPSSLEVKVDAMVCVEKISRYADVEGYKVDVKEEENGEFTLTLNK